MAPLGFTPPPRGGHAIAPKIPKPKAPRITRPKPPNPNQVATDNAMSAFRTALAQLNASTPPVDAAAIRAPYAASQVITGQLGQGYQAAEQRAGAAAQQQYATGRDLAQQHAAAFGISAGAGANPTALQDTGTPSLAAQTAAYTAAAPAATAQWQALLERTAGAKVSAAELARAQGLTAAEQSLSSSLPAAIGNEKDRLFQAHTQKFNEGLAASQLTAKQNADLRNYELGVAKVQTSAGTAAENARIKRQALAEKTATDKAKLAQGNRKLAQGDQSLAIRARASQATAKGLKGVPGALKALQGTTSSSGTQKVAKGWDVQVVALDPDTGEPTGSAQTMTVPDKRKAPKGFQIVKGASAQPHLATVTSKAAPTGITQKQWDQQMRALLAQNPGQSSAVKQFLGPRPKK